MSTTGKSEEIDLTKLFKEDMEKLGFPNADPMEAETTFMVYSMGYLKGATETTRQFEEKLNAML